MPEQETKEVKPTEDQALEILQGMAALFSTNAKGLRKTIDRNLKETPTLHISGTYYREKYALELIPILDRMIEEGRSVEFRYTDFDGFAPNSVYMRLYHGWRYLIDHLDTDDRKYAKLRRRVELQKRRFSIIFRLDHRLALVDIPHHKLEDEDMEMEDEVTTREVDKRWKDKLEEFLDQAQPGQKLELKNLRLSNEEIQETKQNLSQRDDLSYSVSHLRIIVVKPTAEQWEALRRAGQQDINNANS
jgi:hypothetical protein